MAKVVNIHRTSGDRVTEGLPETQFEPVGADGRSYGLWKSAKLAAEYADILWPGQEQDEERSGRGWDIEVIR